MVFLQEVHEFVAEEVLQAMERPFCQFKIDRDTFVPRVTGAPPRLHFSDLPVADFYLNDSLPLVDESRQEMLQFRAVPRIHNFFSCPAAAPGVDREIDGTFPQFHAGPTFGFRDCQEVRFPQKVMGFAFDKFFSWFPFLPAHPLPRFLNPGNFGLHEVKDRFIGASKGSRDADMSRRSDTKVHVPDIFPLDLHFYAGEGQE